VFKVTNAATTGKLLLLREVQACRRQACLRQTGSGGEPPISKVTNFLRLPVLPCLYYYAFGRKLPRCKGTNILRQGASDLVTGEPAIPKLMV
jgi:hypothetical protein